MDFKLKVLVITVCKKMYNKIFKNFKSERLMALIKLCENFERFSYKNFIFYD